MFVSQGNKSEICRNVQRESLYLNREITAALHSDS